MPFEPDQVFGPKARHHVAGTVNGMRVRAVIEPIEGGYGFAALVTEMDRHGFSLRDVLEVVRDARSSDVKFIDAAFGRAG